MLFRKQSTANPPWTEKEKLSKNKETKSLFTSTYSQNRLRYNVLVFVFLLAWFLVVVLWFPPSKTKPHTHTQVINNTKSSFALALARSCNLGNVSVYVYSLPPEFNLGLLNDCHHLNIYTDMCPHVANHGLGQPLASTSWFATHQFIAEMIFHARVENHPCRTYDPNRANLFYVPFYGGLYASSKFRESDLKARDALAVRLADYMIEQPTWRKQNGRDHFLVLGRTAWDFMRKSLSGPDFGANVLLNLPPVLNMSVLTVERHPWMAATSNQHAIPYPSYFHPFSNSELVTWQKQVKQAKRPYLWSFIGGPRKGLEKAAIRDKIIFQCENSKKCKLLKCGDGGSSSKNCHNPSEVLSVMKESEFCLQAPGDSFTRRSTFDAFLAGCIPVFFSPHTAYTQYAWYLPQNPKTYSVYIDEKGNGSQRIEKELLKIHTETVIKRMRERVIDMIPTLTYAHPNATHLGFKDAVDVALLALSNQIHQQI